VETRRMDNRPDDEMQADSDGVFVFMGKKYQTIIPFYL